MTIKDKYIMSHPYEKIECYHCGHVMNINSRLVYQDRFFITQCTKCKKSLSYDTFTFPLYLGWFQ